MANLNYNRAVIAGRLTEDPRLSVTPSGISVCRFTVAYNPPGRNAPPEFYTVDAWRNKAEFVTRYFRRGSSILVEGRMRQDAWENKQTGEKRVMTVIEATDLYFVDAKSEMPEREEVEPDETDLKNAKDPPKVYSTPGARAEIAEQMKEEDLPM